MKTKNVYLALILIGGISWGCTSKEDLSQESLESSINQSVENLNTALDKISSSAGYQVLDISSSSADVPSLVKSSVTRVDSTYNNILLSDIAGVYEYKATSYQKGTAPTMRFFTKTAANDLMIVKLPASKVKNYSELLKYRPADTTLTNNYVVTLTKYQDYFLNARIWEYEMASNINIDDVNAGDLQIQSSKSTKNGYKYASRFNFADGYSIKCDYSDGDTAVCSYSIANATGNLYNETYTSIRNKQDKRHHENKYSFSIGNIKIERKIGLNSLDSAKVYVNNILQTNATVEVIEVTNTTDEVDNSIVNKKRDLKITFDDGTSTTVSELLATNSLDTIRSLFASLRKASFSTAVIDKIAWDIYSNKQ